MGLKGLLCIVQTQGYFFILKFLIYSLFLKSFLDIGASFLLQKVVGDRSRGQSEGSFFNSYYTEV